MHQVITVWQQQSATDGKQMHECLLAGEVHFSVMHTKLPVFTQTAYTLMYQAVYTDRHGNEFGWMSFACGLLNCLLLQSCGRGHRPLQLYCPPLSFNCTALLPPSMPRSSWTSMGVIALSCQHGLSCHCQLSGQCGSAIFAIKRSVTPYMRGTPAGHVVVK